MGREHTAGHSEAALTSFHLLQSLKTLVSVLQASADPLAAGGPEIRRPSPPDFLLSQPLVRFIPLSVKNGSSVKLRELSVQPLNSTVEATEAQEASDLPKVTR